MDDDTRAAIDQLTDQVKAATGLISTVSGMEVDALPPMARSKAALMFNALSLICKTMAQKYEGSISHEEVISMTESVMELIQLFQEISNVRDFPVAQA